MKSLAKASLFKVPFVRGGMWLAGDIQVVRGDVESRRGGREEEQSADSRRGSKCQARLTFTSGGFAGRLVGRETPTGCGAREGVPPRAEVDSASRSRAIGQSARRACRGECPVARRRRAEPLDSEVGDFAVPFVFGRVVREVGYWFRPAHAG
jgi:hypothetical protein